jgi:quercetin dioxygenase-like cupin family protein
VGTTGECCGGDPPCWAHLFDEAEQHGSDAAGAVPVDLPAVARAGSGHGPVWSHRSDDLDANLLVFGASDGVAEHRNTEVDVLLVGVEGEGEVTVDGQPHPLAPGQAILVPKGARRGSRAVGGRFAYLTCHRRRAGLWPTPANRPAS